MFEEVWPIFIWLNWICLNGPKVINNSESSCLSNNTFSQNYSNIYIFLTYPKTLIYQLIKSFFRILSWHREHKNKAFWFDVFSTFVSPFHTKEWGSELSFPLPAIKKTLHRNLPEAFTKSLFNWIRLSVGSEHYCFSMKRIHISVTNWKQSFSSNPYFRWYIF